MTKEEQKDSGIDPRRYSDQYGFKRYLEALSERARCPKCYSKGSLAILVFKDEIQQTMECPDPECDFEKPFTELPTMKDIDETHEEWVARKKGEDAERLRIT